MKKIIIPVVVALLGIGILIYPYIANYYNASKQAKAVQNYNTAVERFSQDYIDEQLNLAQSYNRIINQNPRFPELTEALSDTSPKYDDLLNIQSGVMGYVVIPKINVSLSIYHGVSEKILESGVGHYKGSSLPVGGTGNHSVLTGHTGLVSSKLLSDLTSLAIGDTFYIHILNTVLAYRVDQIKVVEPDDFNYLKPVTSKDYVTLITCTPYGINSHRLLVRGERVPYDAEKEQDDIQQSRPGLLDSVQNQLTLKYGLITALIMLAVIITVIIIKRKFNQKQDETAV